MSSSSETVSPHRGAPWRELPNWYVTNGQKVVGPVDTQLLLGLGYRQLSAAPHNIPEVKRVVRLTSVQEAEHVAREALRLETARDVTNYLREQKRRILPDGAD